MFETNYEWKIEKKGIVKLNNLNYKLQFMQIDYDTIKKYF